MKSLEHLERAVELHDRVEQPFELARTARAGRQRRARQKRNARDSLESALATFDELGAPLWAGKARAELARIGGRAPAGAALTPANVASPSSSPKGRRTRRSRRPSSLRSARSSPH